MLADIASLEGNPETIGKEEDAQIPDDSKDTMAAAVVENYEPDAITVKQEKEEVDSGETVTAIGNQVIVARTKGDVMEYSAVSATEAPKKRFKPPINANYACHTCGMYFTMRAKAVSHLKTKLHATREKESIESNGIYQLCQTCGLKFYREDSYQRHRLDHTRDLETTGKESWIIGIDEKYHEFLVNLPSTSQKTACPICNKKVCNLQMAIHIRVHTGSKPFKCSQCDRAFTDPRNLTAHLRDHAGKQKSKKCEFCGKLFSKTHALKMHKFNRHEQKDLLKSVYTCEYCGKKICSKNIYRTHIQRHEGTLPSIPCPIQGNKNQISS